LVRCFFALVLAASVPSFADDEWKSVQAGPFQVLTTEGDKPAREVLNHLEQLRHALGLQLGQTNLETPWPVQILIVDKKSSSVYPELRFARESWVASTPALQPQTIESVARVLLSSWPGQIPPSLERGLAGIYSTLEVDGTRVTLGAPPARKDRDWSRAHMLAVHPDYSGKLRVLLYNLGKGVERDVAYRNSLGKLPAEIELALDSYIEAGQYGTIPVTGKPVNAQREFVPKDAGPVAGPLAIADLQYANRLPGAAEAYKSILAKHSDSADAQEGLGLLLLASNQPEAAKAHLKAAAEAGNPRSLIEHGKQSGDPAAKQASFVKAAKANPKWAEPYRQMAALERTPSRKAHYLKLAAEREPRNVKSWIALAEVQEEAKEFAEAAKSWTAAERSTDDPKEREEIRLARQGIEKKRVEQQIAEREEARRKAEKELQDLRNKALAEIRAAEARANAGKPVIDPSTLDEYKEQQNSKAEGVLQRVDCTGQRAVLQISSGKHITRLLVPDASQVAVDGGGEKTFVCGPQRPPKKVAVEYTSRPDSRFKTAGDVIVIIFR
jgi:hypothetical protein